MALDNPLVGGDELSNLLSPSRFVGCVIVFIVVIAVVKMDQRQAGGFGQFPGKRGFASARTTENEYALHE